jgi:hypothetical protein
MAAAFAVTRASSNRIGRATLGSTFRALRGSFNKYDDAVEAAVSLVAAQHSCGAEWRRGGRAVSRLFALKHCP